MRNSRLIGRIVVLAAVTVGVAALATLLLDSGGGSHAYRLVFQNASQLVKGNLVQVSGTPVGKVSSIGLTANGQAEVTVSLSGRFAKLHEGTQAVIRQASLSGIANRYIDLQLPPDNAPTISDNGVIDSSHTTSAVDLDQIFNVFGPRERKALSDLIQGFGNQYAGQGKAANAAFMYLNPGIASSARLFNELDRDKRLLTRFITANAHFVSDVAARQNDLAGLVQNLAITTQAIGRQKSALADAVSRLPAFMRRANSTFLNLRQTLADLKPLVDESKPVARKLRPFLAALRPFAIDARPTIHDLAILVHKAGPNNDLTDLAISSVPVRNIAIGPVNVNGASRAGAFPASTQALMGSTPELAFARPYAVDLTGWFSGFSDAGIYDALGVASRVAPYANLVATVGGTTFLIPPDQRAAAFSAQVKTFQNNRCPGTAERVQFPKPTPTYGCDPTQVPPGP